MYNHSGEVIAKVIAPILLEMGIVSKLGYFIVDNVEFNDTYIRAFLK